MMEVCSECYQNRENEKLPLALKPGEHHKGDIWDGFEGCLRACQAVKDREATRGFR